MRKFILPLAGLAVLAAVGALAVSWSHRLPALPSPVTGALPPGILRPAEPLKDEAPREELATPAPEAAAPAPADDLPTLEVAPRIVHTVPEDGAEPIPEVTLRDQSGRVLHSREASAAASARVAPPPPPAVFYNGAAQAAGGDSIAVAGQTVRLFGVKPPEARDNCSLGPGDARPCAEVAKEALQQRFQRHPTVTCRVPPGQRGRAAICLDATGVDLAGFLVSEGLALADPSQSYDYSGAEGVARSFHRGLWRYR